MRRTLALLVLGTVGAAVALTASAASVVMVKTATNSALGTKIVVSSTGLTLYHYIPETKGKIACTGACSTLWPPYVVTGNAKPVAGPGVKASKLGTMKRPDGRTQVTYNGLALYRYSDDTKTGQAKGQGEGGIWFAVTPAGTVTKATAEPSGTAKSAASGANNTSSSSSSSSSGGGGGGGGGAGNGTPANCTPGAVDMDPNSPCYNY
jgi:predicted lipoprotein with Yx(FWY)xxD motif